MMGESRWWACVDCGSRYKQPEPDPSCFACDGVSMQASFPPSFGHPGMSLAFG